MNTFSSSTNRFSVNKEIQLKNQPTSHTTEKKGEIPDQAASLPHFAKLTELTVPSPQAPRSNTDSPRFT